MSAAAWSHCMTHANNKTGGSPGRQTSRARTGRRARENTVIRGLAVVAPQATSTAATSHIQSGKRIWPAEGPNTPRLRRCPIGPLAGLAIWSGLAEWESMKVNRRPGVRVSLRRLLRFLNHRDSGGRELAGSETGA